MWWLFLGLAEHKFKQRFCKTGVSKVNRKFIYIYTNVFFKINTKSYLKKRTYFLKESIPKSRLKIFETMGFYLIKLGNRKILVDFEYLEILEKRKRLIKNKSLTKLSNFEKIYFNNSNKQSFF